MGKILPFADLRHKYGTIFRISLRNKLCVVKEVVRDQDSIFTNRDIPVVAIVATYGANDVVFSQLNPQWRAMRNVFAQEMMNIKILDLFYNVRNDHDEKPVEMGPLIFRTELKVMMNMLWGGKFIGEEGEGIASEFLVVAPKIVDLFGKPNIFDFFPLLAGLNIQGVKKQMNHNLCDEKCE
ncbi:PREDICTED: cytochrome P450 84A1-like [Erythranthe guttata]|uniref:cytochrome P450 84A1-like n=1 Tax=Erythranthe guttata TaxID=4155 RepID=UPI00064D88F5|nr:PREDICTED: cytochrome P450 84A1-like [Erythranthe guttata]|eukprot:XP_012851391.1 PREDICTED: cytochrome P450 84A1-like [Erythranthe guttata]